MLEGGPRGVLSSPSPFVRSPSFVLSVEPLPASPPLKAKALSTSLGVVCLSHGGRTLDRLLTPGCVSFCHRGRWPSGCNSGWRLGPAVTGAPLCPKIQSNPGLVGSAEPSRNTEVLNFSASPSSLLFFSILKPQEGRGEVHDL